jgi:LysM repeat protein
MRKYTLLTALFLTAIAAHSQDIYLQYDASCMDKMEYRFVESTNGSSNVAFTTYRVNYGAQEKVFLEAGLESVIVKKTIPGKLSKCSTKLSKSDIADINTGKRKAFVCKKLDSGWAIIPTSSAAYMYFNNNTLSYKNASFDLQSELKEGQGGDNLAASSPNNDPKASVFYLGDMRACDAQGHIFKMSPCDICKIDAEVTFLPTIGMIREQETNGQLYELTSINGLPVCDYMKGAKAPVPPKMVEPQPESIVIKEEPVNDCSLVAEEGQHVVQRGENVYSIARRYGIAVTSLRSWNSLSTDVIQPCTALKVVAPPKPVEQPSMAVARNNDVPMSYNKVVKPQVVTKTVTKVETKYVTKIVCEAKAREGEHVVQQGENLSTVAKLYNVSVSELRSWNKMKNDKLETCSRLKVTEPVVIVKKEVPVSYAAVVKPKVKKVVVTPKAVAHIEKKPVVTPKAVAHVEKKIVKTEPVLFVKKNSGFHVVQRNETVSGIAKQYHLSETIVRRCNNLDATETLKKGQVLNIQNCACDVSDEPKPSSYNTVVVKEKKATVKTTPSDVPESYNTVVMPRPIKAKENTEGVTAKGVETRVRKYHVVKGDDTLESIARAYNTDEKKLRTLNRLDAGERVIPNQLLILE